MPYVKLLCAYVVCYSEIIFLRQDKKSIFLISKNKIPTSSKGNQFTGGLLVIEVSRVGLLSSVASKFILTDSKIEPKKIERFGI